MHRARSIPLSAFEIWRLGTSPLVGAAARRGRRDLGIQGPKSLRAEDDMEERQMRTQKARKGAKGGRYTPPKRRGRTAVLTLGALGMTTSMAATFAVGAP